MTTPRLSLVGDLDFEVDGTAGTVRAVDHQVRVDLMDPVAALHAVTGTYGGRGGIARLASRVAESGVTVRVHGPRGLLTTIGADVDSWLGGVLAGSRQVSAGPAALTSLLVPYRRSAAVGVAALLVGLGVARRR